MNRAVVSVIGRDTVGIIANVSALLSRYKINILDISQTVMQDMFAMVLLADVTELAVDFAELAADMASLGRELGLDIHIMRDDVFDAMHRI